MFDIFLIGLAVLALLGVVLEDIVHINKAKVTLFLGTLAWISLFVHGTLNGSQDELVHGLRENISEIAELWLFLVAAMTFVAYLNKKGMIKNVIYLFLPTQISERALLFLTGVFCFTFSSLADNITATLVSVTLILSLKLSTKKTVRFAALVVFAVNSGGVALITGDVTTLMIFLADKVRILDLFYLSLPALGAVLLLAMLLSRPMKGQVMIQKQRTDIRGVDIAIAITFLSTILMTIAGNAIFRIPPMLTFLFGLSIMFLIARFYQDDEEEPILEYIRIIEFETLLFFLGILLLVGMLKEIHVLDSLVGLYHMFPPIVANYLMGMLSATIDNVPLTAALLKAGIEMPPAAWLSLTYAVGVGGSLLVIGSAAGVVAMSKLEEVTFFTYFRYFAALLIAYTVGYFLSYFVGFVML